MKIELTQVKTDGTGCFVVHLDDGTSFDQSFHGAPVEDADALLVFCADLAETVAARQTIQEKILPQTVTAMIGEKRDVVRPQKGPVNAKPA